LFVKNGRLADIVEWKAQRREEKKHKHIAEKGSVHNNHNDDEEIRETAVRMGENGGMKAKPNTYHRKRTNSIQMEEIEEELLMTSDGASPRVSSFLPPRHLTLRMALISKYTN